LVLGAGKKRSSKGFMGKICGGAQTQERGTKKPQKFYNLHHKGPRDRGKNGGPSKKRIKKALLVMLENWRLPKGNS